MKINPYMNFDGTCEAAFKFYAEHGDQIERIAIVGDAQWWEKVKLFVAADLRRAEVQCFVRGAIAMAREWIAEGGGPGANRTG